MPINDLYRADKYGVVQGRGGHIGFCTVWNDPEIVLKQEPRVLDHVALLGSLYSREGVNIILRNLCLNPQISTVLVWGHGALSQTPIGVTGKETLQRIWTEGLDRDGAVPATGFKLHPTVDATVVKNVTENVALVDVSHLPLSDIVTALHAIERKEPYMAPASFEEFVRSEDMTFPSEEVGFAVRGAHVTDAWINVIDKIMRYGTIKKTEYGNRMRELQVVTWVIEAEDVANRHIPDWPDELKRMISLDAASLDTYIANVFFDPFLPEGTAYTYGNRLYAYPGGVDQVAFMINKIKESDGTRRAVAVLFHPPTDEPMKSPPCVNLIQVLVNDGKLNMFVTVRSHDIFKAGIPNAFGLRALQAHIAKETGHAVGRLAITSNSAHIYEEEWEHAKKVCACQIWERAPRLAFDEKNDADPRGMVVITVANDAINADVLAPDGSQLLTVSGTTANEIAKKFTQLDLLLRPDHWTYLGMELQKAEIAQKLGLTYNQDKPLVLEGADRRNEK